MVENLDFLHFPIFRLLQRKSLELYTVIAKLTSPNQKNDRAFKMNFFFKKLFFNEFKNRNMTPKISINENWREIVIEGAYTGAKWLKTWIFTFSDFSTFAEEKP